MGKYAPNAIKLFLIQQGSQTPKYFYISTFDKVIVIGLLKMYKNNIIKNHIEETVTYKF